MVKIPGPIQNLRRIGLATGLFLLLVAIVTTGPGFSQTLAYDDAGNYQKSANWTNASNQGFGFGPWIFATNGPSFHGWYCNNGFAIRSVTNVGGTDYTNCSWGLYANGSGLNRTVAYRGFAGGNSLTTNVAFKLQWMSDGIGPATTNLAGFVLRHGNATNNVPDYTNAARFQYYYSGGGVNSYLVSDGNGVTNLGIPFASGGAPFTGMNCEFLLQPGDTYRFVVRSATNNAILAVVDGRPLAGSGTIDSAALFDFQTTDDNNFNRIQIVSNALIAPIIWNILPTNNAGFVNPASSNLTFQVDSPGSTITGTNVSLTLNGIPQSLAFNTNSPTPQLFATNTTALESNILYTAVILATDDNGLTTTNISKFNTIQRNALWYDVKNYGATGNGTTKDTSALQATINACAPGGFVWLHDGVYLSGTIYLKDNMTLFIDPSATLLSSGSPADYPDQNPPLSNSQTSNCKKALVYAQGRTNIAVGGGGTIYGNGLTNFTSGVEATRPISIWTALCTNVTLQNISIIDSSMWTMVNMQSDYVFISDVVINAPSGANRDGCDLVDCWHVTVQNCTINSSDDSICLKSGNSRGMNDVLVKNCTITRSSSNGIKFGTASKGPFFNITFQDCTVLNTAHSAMAVESVDGSAIHDIIFQRINSSGCQNAIFIVLGSRSGAAVGSVTNIQFHDITASNLSDTRGCPISGCFTNGVTYKLRNILFDNVTISFKGGLGSVPAAPPEYAGQYPENTMWGNLPACGYYLRHADGVTFTNCYTRADLADARPWVATNDVSNLTIQGSILNYAQTPSSLILQWDRAFVLQAATNVPGPYLDIGGASSPYTNQLSSGQMKFFRLRQ